MVTQTQKQSNHFLLITSVSKLIIFFFDIGSFQFSVSNILRRISENSLSDTYRFKVSSNISLITCEDSSRLFSLKISITSSASSCFEKKSLMKEIYSLKVHFYFLARRLLMKYYTGRQFQLLARLRFANDYFNFFKSNSLSKRVNSNSNQSN